MNLKSVYYSLRPLARVSRERRNLWSAPKDEKKPMHPIIGFMLGSVLSIFGGFLGGGIIWGALGLSPDGWSCLFTAQFLCHSILIVVRTKNRGLFYGVNLFTVLTLWLLFTGAHSAA